MHYILIAKNVYTRTNMCWFGLVCIDSLSKKQQICYVTIEDDPDSENIPITTPG